MNKKIPVAILGANGSVGQRFIQLLEGHPWFEVRCLTGSDRSIGKPYKETCHWILPEKMPDAVRNMVIKENEAAGKECVVAFSAMPADQAKAVEPLLAAQGLAVVSNASAHRMDADVPILLPEVNPEHTALVNIQTANKKQKGFIVTNPNCTSTGLTVSLKPLLDTFGIKQVIAVSLQALSGAGYPGVASLDIIDNVVPFIKGEEEKVESEPLKMLGCFVQNQIQKANFVISAHTNRVAVTDGHTVCVSIKCDSSIKPEDAVEVMRSYQCPEISRELPSSPWPVIQVMDEVDRPQPRLDRAVGNGMTTIVGRVRVDPIMGLKYVVLSHNTIRGAAGGAIYNAELLVQQKLVG
ncbi:MAG: aspartate-semialdehyde dehydrogenase [Leptolinea sp.]|jgi:aspartate-semialdehyde dehydrogenase|nr:aspartate-semialdehyde dehydrogenase [Leptolinea sp.]